MTHPSTSRHGHPQKTSSALIRFDPLKMQYCAVGVLESHNDYNEIHRRLTSRHVLDMFGSHASLSDSHPSSFLLPSIPPLHLGHRTFLNRCRPLLHDDLHGDIWAQLGTCPDNFQQPSRIVAKNPGFQSYTWPPASFHKTEIQ